MPVTFLYKLIMERRLHGCRNCFLVKKESGGCSATERRFSCCPGSSGLRWAGAIGAAPSRWVAREVALSLHPRVMSAPFWGGGREGGIFISGGGSNAALQLVKITFSPSWCLKLPQPQPVFALGMGVVLSFGFSSWHKVCLCSCKKG